MAKAEILYHGDLNPEHGGYFYTLKDGANGFAAVVRITPCSDAGLAENEFWIERLTVNFPDNESEETEVLSVIGVTLAEVETKRDTDEYYSTIINACLAYGKYDKAEPDEVVRIGKRDEFARECMKDSDITVRLPHNALIGNYARKIARDFF